MKWLYLVLFGKKSLKCGLIQTLLRKPRMLIRDSRYEISVLSGTQVYVTLGCTKH